MPGFKWYGRNRKNNHVNAKTGSGGVGFLVKEQFINDFHVEIKDNSHDDILWLNLRINLILKMCLLFTTKQLV